MQVLKNKKKLILGILLDILICIFAFLIFFFSLSNKTTEVSSSFNNAESNVLTVNIDNTSTGNEEDVAEIVTDEKASDKELKEEKVTKKEQKKSTSPYYIKVNYKANVVTVYKKDKDDKYTVPYKAMVCSCGTYTPHSGTYKTSSKHRWGKLIHDVYGQYATRIVGSILFHSVPYSSNSADTLLYNEYDKLGTTASAGCVRLTIKDCKWIYDNCPKGTMVEFYSNSDPGPLGKPTAQKISSFEECRNWDPTDPASENPWHTYKKEEEKPSEDVSSNVTNDVTNNVVNENINNTVDNSIDNNISNENTNNSVVNNNIIDNSSSSNNVITDTNSTINNNTVDNTIDNNTVNNSTVSNNTIDNSSSSNNSTDSSNNLNNTNTDGNSSVDNNVTNTPSSSGNTDTNNNTNGSVNNDSVQNNTNTNNLIINNIV